MLQKYYPIYFEITIVHLFYYVVFNETSDKQSFSNLRRTQGVSTVLSWLAESYIKSVYSFIVAILDYFGAII